MQITRTLGSLGLSIAAMLACGFASAAERVGDFSLLDQIGNHHQMSWYDDHRVIALLVQANDSESSRAAIPEFVQLQRKYASQGIQFFMINPMGRMNRTAVNAEVSRYTTEIPVLMDDTRLVSQALGVDKTGEVFLFNPNSFRVVYRGPTGPNLENALQAVSAGREIVSASIESAPIQSADVHYPKSNFVSYETEIAPIIAENCAICHREGGIAPFALDSYTMAQGWSPMIREVLMTKRMPPGQVDPHVHKFTNGRNLEIAELQKMISWIEAGSPRDGTTDPLAELSWPDTKWIVGSEPDLIVKVPRQTIPATGVLDWLTLSVPIVGMEKDRWLRASEFIPGDRTVVHHATGTLAGSGLEGGTDIAVLNRYVPGSEPRIEMPNTGGLVKKNSVVNVTMHYTTSGKEAVDESEFGLWFYPEDVIPEERMKARLIGVFGNAWSDIPPYAKNHEMVSSYILPEDADVYQYHPHMHFRGKDLRMYADLPDGTREELINIANYSYAWQLTYNLETPIFLPQGTKVTSVGHFDNSAQNSANPDPSVSVPYGEQSWDEMFFGEIIWKARNP